MKSNGLIERLSIQVDAFQAGFNVLSESKSLADMGKNFCHLLRGIFTASYVNLYFKSPEKNEFAVVCQQEESTFKDIDRYISQNGYHIFELTEDNSVVAVLPCQNKSMFAVLIGPKLSKEKLSDDEKVTLLLFMHLLDNAFQTLLMRKAEKDLIFSLNNAVLQMNSLIDTGIELAKTPNEQKLLNLALERAIAMTNASGGTVTITDMDQIVYHKNFPETFTFRDKGQKKDDYSAVEAAFTFLGKQYSTTLYDKESRSGIVSFDDTDHLLLNALARQAHAAIENDYLQERAVEMEKVKKEMAIAAAIQRDLVPKSDPENKYLEIASLFKPADAVGGDYFDYFERNDNKLGLAIADVSGHGTPAALVMTMMKGIVHSITHDYRSTNETLEEVNAIVSGIIPPDIFITMQFLMFDLADRSMSIANAGHNPVLHYVKSEKKCRQIEVRGCALNVMAGIQYTNMKVALNPGDYILVYTDGINEAHNKNEEMFGISRIVEAVEKNGALPAKKLIDHIHQEIFAFTGNVPQADDMLIIAVKIL